MRGRRVVKGAVPGQSRANSIYTLRNCSTAYMLTYTFAMISYPHLEYTTTMSAVQKFHTLLPVLASSTAAVEDDLKSRLTKCAFKSGNAQTTAQWELPPSPTIPARSYYTTAVTTAASPATPPPSVSGSPQQLTVATEIPLFDRRKGQLFEGVSKQPVVLKLQQISSNPLAPTTTTSTVAAVHTIGKVAKRRRHVCKTCTMGFTTAGHLSRHNRIHTGEKNHTCPHDGCHQKFSRHDNCIQHYRTHLKKRE